MTTLKYIILLIITGEYGRHEEPVDVYFDEQSAAEHFARLVATYDATHQAAVVEVARHEPSHYQGRAIKYAACSGETAWIDSQYAA